LPPETVRVYGVVAAEAAASAAAPSNNCASPSGPYGTVSAQASASIEGASRSHSCSWSAGDDSPNCSPPKIAVQLIEREFPVLFENGEYVVDIPYQFAVSTSVSLSPSGHDGNATCDETIPWGNGAGSASATAARLLDVFTAGDVVYLLAYTALVDGAGAFCDPDFCFIQPATGQIATPAGFAAVDFPHTGYAIRSNPAHRPRQELPVEQTYGLETIRIVFDAAREDRDYRLKDMWHISGVVPVWQSFGDRTFLDSVDDSRYERHEGVPKYREVTIYDANGIALRFWGERQDDGSWRYYGLQGVFSELVENHDRPGEFYLLGGPPGAMREKGSWLYIFNPIDPVNGRFSGLSAKLRLLADPAGNLITIDHPAPGSAEPTLLAYQPVDAGTPLKAMRRFWSGGLEYNSRQTEWQQFGTVGTAEVDWGDFSVRWRPNDGAWIGNRREYWTTHLFDIREATPFMRYPDTVPSGLDGQRLHTRQVGNLNRTTYDYGWRDIEGNPSRIFFTITAQQEGKRPKWLTYKVRPSMADPLRKEFAEAQMLLPSLPNATVYDRTLYHFNANGQIDLVRFFSTRWDDQPQWETNIVYDPVNPSLVNSVTFTDFNANRSFTTQYNWKMVSIPPFAWQGQTIERGVEWVLGSVQDPTGVRVELLYPHEVDDPGEAPPVAPVRIRDGAGNETRIDYHRDGRLKQLWEPGHTNPWQLAYYPDPEPQDDRYLGRRRLQQITDPTGKSFTISRYDALGRPTRVEVRPNATTLLWQEVDWNLLGLPTQVRWSDNSSVRLDWSQGTLIRLTDARERTAQFWYNHPRGFHLLSDILIGGLRFASLDYDAYGRLKRVVGGNGVGVTYGYDDPTANDLVGERDVLRWVRYDGDLTHERFTYRCCGELERWIKPDGRWANFTYEAGLLTQVTTNEGQVYSYDYDAAGRLKHAQNSVAQTNYLYEYEIGTNTGRLHSETTTLPVGTYSHQYTYYPDSRVETATLTMGGFSRQLRYVYDDAGRLTDIYYNNQLLASYSYDNAGRLQSQTIRPLGSNHRLTTTLTYADAQSVGALGTVEWRWNNQWLASFDYDGYDNQPGYYHDGTLARAIDTLPGVAPIRWEWDYDDLGQLAYEKRREGNGEWQQTSFTYDLGGNLWGNAGWVYRFNQLLYVPRTEMNNNWYFAYTPNGERERWWTTDRGEALQGDVNRDGQVDDSDLLAVQFAFGRTDCPCPEDLNGDGQVDDTDLLMVLFNFGQSAGGVVSWEYAYDIWGNLVQAASPAAGVYRAGYDALGRRIWEEVQTAQGTRRTYYLYEGDTIIGEVSPEGMYAYVWGLLGPIARIALNKPADTRYYVIDGLGHVRALVNLQGVPTDLYHYDSWGNPLPTGTETTRQPFRWNGAYGYEYIPATGLYHVGTREYDPRTARWLQRDPIDAASGDPNLYRYCLNDPVNLADPSGLDFWEDLKRWYMGGMGGLSQWVDQNLMFGLTERFGTTAGRYDCGQASGWQLAWDATLWGGALLLAGFSSVVPGDEVVISAATARGVASQGVRSMVRTVVVDISKLRFATKQKLLDHFQKHGAEFGARSADEYLKKARAFIARSADNPQVLTHITKEGKLYLYDPSTNEFAALSSDGKHLLTYFKPKKRMEYWRKQLCR